MKSDEVRRLTVRQAYDERMPTALRSGLRLFYEDSPVESLDRALIMGYFLKCEGAEIQHVSGSEVLEVRAVQLGLKNAFIVRASELPTASPWGKLKDVTPEFEGVSIYYVRAESGSGFMVEKTYAEANLAAVTCAYGQVFSEHRSLDIRSWFCYSDENDWLLLFWDHALLFDRHEVSLETIEASIDRQFPRFLNAFKKEFGNHE